jgi:hypothetical protein
MSQKILFKRGTKANLPTLSIGEPAFTTDSNDLYVGNGTSNIRYIKESEMIYETASGTGTAMILTLGTLTSGYSKKFIANINNGGSATTINATYPLYKPNTTTAPNLVAGKAYSIWYNSASSCFFCVASAEGDVIASQVLASKTFSNDSDVGLTGTMIDRTGTITTADAIFTDGSGLLNVRPKIGYYDGVAGTNTQVIDSNFISTNIKSGVSVFGLAGNSNVVDTSPGTATAAQILASQIAFVDGAQLTGTMVNKSGTIIGSSAIDAFTASAALCGGATSNTSVGAWDMYIPEGYYNGSSLSRIHIPNLYPSNIKAGAQAGWSGHYVAGTYTSDATATAPQILASQTAYVNGNKITGTMATIGAANISSSCSQWGDGALAVYLAQSGYYLSGSGGGSSEVKVPTTQLQAAEAELVAANIVTGKNIFGVIGTATAANMGGLNFASGTVTSSASAIAFTTVYGNLVYMATATVTGLTFLPTFISLKYRDGTTLTYSTIYEKILPDPVYAGAIVRSFSNTNDSGGNTGYGTYCMRGDTSPVVISSTGFTLPIYTSNGSHLCSWFAIG